MLVAEVESAHSGMPSRWCRCRHFPVTMLSNSFVPTSGMPTWLRVVADWNPVSSLTQASRHLFGSPGAVTSRAWPMQHPVPAALLWAVVILAVCVPLAARRYRNAGR